MEETTDVVSLQTAAAISPEQLGVSVQTQRVAIGVGLADFRSAVSRYCAAYRRDALDRLSFEFSRSHSNYATTYGFTGLTVNSDEPEEQAMGRIRSVWESSMALYIASVSFQNKWYLVPCVVVLVITMIAFLMNPLFGVGALVVGGAVVLALGEKEKRSCAEKVAEAEQVRERAIEHSISMLRDANAEFVDANLTYQELDEGEADLLELIDTWPTAASQQHAA